MTTISSPGFNMSTASLQKAGRDNFYWHIQPTKKSQVSLTGAVAKWKKDPNFIYIPDVHLAGTVPNLQAALTLWGYTSQIPGLLQSAYTAALLTAPDTDPKKQAFNAEVDRTRLSNLAKKAQKKVWTPSDISYFASELSKPTTTIVDSQGNPITAKVPGKRAAAPRDVLGRLKGLGANKVLDASKATSDGKNIRSINAPGTKSQKRGPVINELSLGISNKRIISNNATTYNYALTSVFGAASPLIAKYANLWAQSRAISAPNLTAVTPLAVAPRVTSPSLGQPLLVGSTSPRLVSGGVSIPTFSVPGSPRRQ